jgi:hypothetical protein
VDVFKNPAEIIRKSLTAIFEPFEWMSYVLTMCVGSKHMISSRRFFFPESCVRQFAETRGNDTFTAWVWLRECATKFWVIPRHSGWYTKTRVFSWDRGRGQPGRANAFSTCSFEIRQGSQSPRKRGVCRMLSRTQPKSLRTKTVCLHVVCIAWPWGR